MGVGDKFVLSVLLNLADFWLIKYKLTFSFWCEEGCTDFPFKCFVWGREQNLNEVSLDWASRQNGDVFCNQILTGSLLGIQLKCQKEEGLLLPHREAQIGLAFHSVRF